VRLRQGGTGEIKQRGVDTGGEESTVDVDLRGEGIAVDSLDRKEAGKGRTEDELCRGERRGEASLSPGKIIISLFLM
jgi:hypothetical protein